VTTDDTKKAASLNNDAAASILSETYQFEEMRRQLTVVGSASVIMCAYPTLVFHSAHQSALSRRRIGFAAGDMASI
jgi:hypothetical protein